MNSMTKPDSKRGYKRYGCCFSASCARLNSVQYIRGRMMNYSQNGLYFESESALRPGLSVLIRVQKNLAADTNCEIKEGFRSLVLGEVKWCKKFISEGAAYYGIGVKYYPPYY